MYFISQFLKIFRITNGTIRISRSSPKEFMILIRIPRLNVSRARVKGLKIHWK